MKLGFESVTKTYGDKIIARDFSLLFDSGTILCVMGPSGCGKTTLLNIAAGLIPFDEGKVIGFHDKKISYIFQQPRLLPFMSVRKNIELVMKKKDRASVDRFIELVQLKGNEKKFPNELSGGMQQRVSFARALAYEPEIILADEPASNLDIALKRYLYETLRAYAKEHSATVLMVTHDPEDCISYSDEAIVLSSSPIKILYRTKLSSQSDKKRIKNEMIGILDGAEKGD